MKLCIWWNQGWGMILGCVARMVLMGRRRAAGETQVGRVLKLCVWNC